MVAVSTRSGSGASRVTAHIKRKPASHLYHAVRIAEAIGLPLTHFVTINFAHTACPNEQVSSCFERLRADRFSPWVRRPSRKSAAAACAPTYAWVIENANGTIGVHWLLHLPSGRVEAFKAKLGTWLEDVTGASIQPGAIDVRIAEDPRGAGKYMLKGIDPAWAKFYGTRHEDQGSVCGKRSGYSRNIGPTAKRRLRDAKKYRQARYMGAAADAADAPMELC